MSHDRARRNYVYSLLEEQPKISATQRATIAERFGCSVQTIHNDIILYKARTDDKALRSLIRRKWSSHRTRANKHGVPNTLTFEELMSLYMSPAPHCHECGREQPREELVPDHLISMAWGGANAIENIRLCCGTCNNHRNGKEIRQAWQESDGALRWVLLRPALWDWLESERDGKRRTVSQVIEAIVKQEREREMFKQMSFEQAVKVMAGQVEDNATYQERVEVRPGYPLRTVDFDAREYAGSVIAQETGADYDWIMEGDWDGDETADDIREEWRELEHDALFAEDA